MIKLKKIMSKHSEFQINQIMRYYFKAGNLIAMSHIANESNLTDTFLPPQQCQKQLSESHSKAQKKIINKT